jgi:hypothetical protein
MSASLTTLPHFFDAFPMRRVGSHDLDAVLAESAGQGLAILFLWGRDCPNCDIAKAQMLLSPQRFQWPQVCWLQGNVYEDPDLGTRFGLHGIPAFMLFRSTRRIGRISPWPGTQRFCAAVEAQLAIE